MIVSGCSADSASTSYALNKNQPGFFNPNQVKSHFDFVKASNLDQYRMDGTSTLSCVDARSDEPAIGTPGGDLAEFAIGLHSYNNLSSQVSNYASVKTLFQQFLSTQISASRPFYFHTDDTRLQQVFTAVGTALNRTITILPSSTPLPDELNTWLNELVQSYAQGCGHIRLMIASPVIYGLQNSQIIQWLIRAFYEELWAADNDNDNKRAKLAFVVKLGPLQGKAVAIVSNKAGTCSGYSPALPPNIGGSSIFIYTPSAAKAFRTSVMTPFFAAQGAAGWNSVLFQTKANDLFDKQLGATLDNLAPANQASLIAIDVTTVGEPKPNSATSISNICVSAVTAGSLFMLALLL